jgi:hypothetical protein
VSGAPRRRALAPSPIVLLLGLAAGAVVFGPARAWAGPDEATDVVAPYVHLPIAIAPATGPFSTVFMIRSTRTAPVQVQVTCFNDASEPVGPVPQPRFLDIAQHQTYSLTPDQPAPLGIASHPNFTGLGFCYFSSTDKFSVDVVWGFSGGPVVNPLDGLPDSPSMRMFSSNASVGVAVAVGQATVAGGIPGVTGLQISGVGGVPIWVGGNWVDVLVLVNPTASSGLAFVDVFACAGCSPMAAPLTVTVPLPPRGMGLVPLSSFAGGFPDGNATIRSGGTCCFVGWHWALNPTTRQALFREVPLDRDTTRFLSVTDRP